MKVTLIANSNFGFIEVETPFIETDETCIGFTFPNNQAIKDFITNVVPGTRFFDSSINKDLKICFLDHKNFSTKISA